MNRVEKIIKAGYGKKIALLGYTESNTVMFPSSAQMQIYDRGDEPFEDTSETFVDFFNEKQIDDFIDALKEIKESFNNK